MGTQRPWLMPATVALVLVCLSNIEAAPAPSTCRLSCPAATDKTGQLLYAAGHIYKYDLDTELSVHLTGTDATATKVHVHGVAEVYAAGACKFALRLRDIIVDAHDKAAVADLQLDSVVQFALGADDALVPEICVDDAHDNEFGLNIKRAIISLLQSASHRTHETDVFGTCPTTFSASKTGNGASRVTKTRNLNACSQREHLSTRLVQGIFDEGAGVTSTPLLNGDYACEQTIADGIVQAAVLNEEYTFVPLTAGEAGIRARGATTLKLQSGSPAKGTVDVSRATQTRTLLFVNPAATPTKIDDAKLRAAFVSTYGQFKTAGSNNVEAHAAEQFTELVRLMRQAQKAQLLTFFNEINKGTVKEAADKDFARSLYLDALFRTVSSPSVQAIADLSREFNDKERSQAYWSLALVRTIDAATLPSIEKLLDARAPRHAYLTIGSLVHKYCRHQSCGKEIDRVLDKFNAQLTKPLTGNAKNRKNLETNALFALKGIRNANHLPNPKAVVDLTGAKHSTRLRAQALQTLAANACHAGVQKAVAELLQNRDVDAELRIEAYRTYVACPSGRVANTIKTLLDDEQSHQVGAYITSHLASLRSSTDRYRQSARQHFANVRAAPDRFPSDLRQYSFNHEYSYAVGSLGVGASVDTAVVYSPQSFLPRSGRMNVTGALFGSTVNVFELSARQEHLERVLERSFGPKGVYNTMTLQEASDKLTEQSAGKGSSSDAADAIADLNLDVSLRIFGSEMVFLSLGDNVPTDSDALVGTVQRLGRKLFASAKGFNELYQSRSLLLDTELVYPTGAGLPLRLSANGAAAGRLQADGKIDLEAIQENPKATAFVFNVEPSYSVQVSVALSVDAFVTATGIRLSGSAHSSTGIRVDFKLLSDGRSFETAIGMPVTKQQLFSVEHNVQVETRDRGRAVQLKDVKFSTKPETHSGCFDQLEKLTGVTVCGTLSTSLPSVQTGVAPFPLAGPAKIEAYLEVAPRYQLNAEYTDAEPGVRQLRLTFDTPGSQVSRKANVELEVATKEAAKYVRVNAAAGEEQLTAEIGLTNSATALELYGVYKANAANRYRASVGFTKANTSPTLTTYTPAIVLEKGDKAAENSINGYQLSGTLTVETLPDDGKRIQFNRIQLVGNSFKPITVSGEITARKDRAVSGDVKLEQDKKTIALKGRFHFVSLQHIVFDLSNTCNFNEWANGRVKFELDRTDESFKNDITIVAGKDPDSTTKRIDLHQDYHYKIDNKAVRELKADFKLDVPCIESKLKVAVEFRPNYVAYNVDAGARRHTVSSSATAKLNGKKPGDYDVQVTAAVNAHNVKVDVGRDVGAGKSTIRNAITSSFGTKINVDGDISHDITPQSADVTVTGSIVLATKEPQVTFSFVLKNAPKTAASNGKLSIDNKQLLAYDIHVNRDDTKKDAKFSVKLADTVTADGQMTSKSGKGDGSVLVNLPNLGRKLKLVSTFVAVAPTYDASHELFYDFEKDNTKRVTVDTKNVIGDGKVDHSTTVELGGEKYVVTAGSEGKAGELGDGRYTVRADLTLPTQRKLAAEYKRDAHRSADDVYTGRYDARVSDTMANKKERSATATVNYKGAGTASKAKKGDYNFASSLTLADFDGKTALLTNEFKNEPVGEHFRTASALVTLKGTLLKEVIDVQLVADEYCASHAVYHASAKYGGHVTLNVKGNYYLNHGNKPLSYEIQTDVALPQTEYKQLRATASGRYVRPSSDDGVYEFEYKESLKVNDNAYTVDATFKGNARKGNSGFKLSVPDASPFSVETTYDRTDAHDGDDSSGGSSEETNSVDAVTERRGTIEIRYGNGKTLKGSSTVKRTGYRSVAVDATLVTPLENAKNIDFAYKWEKSNGNQIDALLATTIDDRKFKTISTLILSDAHPSFSLTVDYPQRKQLAIVASTTRLADRRYKAELKLANFGDFNLDGTGEIAFVTADTFRIATDIDAPKLSLNHLHAEAAAKPNAAGRGLDFSASAADKNIVSGSVAYTVSGDGREYTGQGDVKWFDQAKAAKFKLTKDGWDTSAGTYGNNSIIFEAHVGNDKKLSFTLLSNTTVFHVATSLCEANNKCYVIEVKSLYDATALSHEVLVLVDLLQVGLNKEFRLQAATTRKRGAFRHSHEIRLKSAKDNALYMYLVKADGSQASVELVTPKRTLALDSVYRLPARNEIFGHYELSVTSYIDKKNQPDKKATAAFVGDLKRTDGQVAANGEVRVAHWGVKELRISGKSELDTSAVTVASELKFDIFQNANQAVVVVARMGNSEGKGFAYDDFNVTATGAVRSAGLDVEYAIEGHAAVVPGQGVSAAGSVRAPATAAGFFVFASADRVELVVSGFDVEVVRIDGKRDRTTDSATVTASLRSLSAAKPLVAEATLSKKLRSLKVSVARDGLLRATGEATFGRVLSEKLLDGNGKEVHSGQLALDAEHFLSSDFKFDEDGYKKFLRVAAEQVKNEGLTNGKKLTEHLNKVKDKLKQQGESIRNAVPQLDAVAAEYKEQAKKLGNELLEDKTIKEAYEFLHGLYGTIGKTFGDIWTVIVENNKKLYALIQGLYNESVQAFNERLLPALKESWSQIELTVSALYEETVSLVISGIEHVVAVLKTFEKEFGKVGKVISEYLKRVAGLVDRSVEYARKELADIVKLLEDSLRSLPGWDFYKSKLQEIFGDKFSAANLVTYLDAGASVVADLMPTTESKTFVEQLRKYLANKLNSVKVNDIEELKTIYGSLVTAIQSLVAYARSEFTKNGINFTGPNGAATFTPFRFAPVHLSLDALKRLPYLATFELSAWNYLRNEPLPSLRDILYTYRPYSFNPLEFLPPFEKHAQIADGQHIFTFDGRHITFPGTCQYTLAEDTLDANFTIVARLAGGKLKSITLSDRGGNKIELSANGAVKVAGAATDLPIHQDDLHAWRDYYRVTVLTTYGASVCCTLDLRICSVTVNGFYHGRMRGILGNANGEQTDDWTAKNGKLADNAADFCNSYKTETKCGDVADDNHKTHANTELCASHFADTTSSLRFCFFFIRPHNYRTACERAVAHQDTVEAKQEAACALARAYAVACSDELIPVDVDAKCTRCEADDVAVGDKATVTVPHSKADIVLVLDTDLPIKDALVPAITRQLRAELKQRGVTDVHLAVIGYGERRQYHSHFTSNGRLDVSERNTYADTGPTYDAPPKIDGGDVDRYAAFVWRAIVQLSEDLQITADSLAFSEAVDYPFRRDASRAIIAIRSKPLAYSVNPTKQIAGVAVNQLVRQAGIALHLIEPIQKVEAEGGPAGSIIGFNKKHYIALAAGTKKQTSSFEQRQSLKFDPDLGIDLVLDSDGYVFNAAYYANAKDGDKKRFVGVLATSIADQLSRSEVTSACECEITESIFAKQTCEVKESRLRPPTATAPRKAGARG